eukprot:6478150-Amphidinium_carterae.1
MSSPSDVATKKLTLHSLLVFKSDARGTEPLAIHVPQQKDKGNEKWRRWDGEWSDTALAQHGMHRITYPAPRS